MKSPSRRPKLRKKRSPRDRAVTPRLQIVVTGADALLAGALRRACRRAFAEQKLTSGLLEVAVVGAQRMRELHRRWMSEDSPTDVLTFDLRERPVDEEVDAQLVICESVARAKARRSGVDWRHELLLYAVHGCLHLCGYDDRRRMDAERMHRREDEILTALGYGPVFSAPGKVGSKKVRNIRKHR